MQQKYLLVKGACGFADRLQCLSHAIEYAKKYDRILCIDWTDPIWAGRQANINFDTFFDLVGVPSISLAELLHLVDQDADAFADVFPEAWRHQVDRRPGDFMYRSYYKTELKEDVPHKLVVYASVSYRVFHNSNICANLRVKHPYRPAIVKALKEYADYTTVVHVRGTDRVQPAKYEEHAQMLSQKLQAQQQQELPQVLIVTDCKPLAEHLISLYPRAVLRQTPWNEESATTGSHMAAEHNKIAFNTDTLIDFFLLMYAKHVVTDDDSLFGKMSRFIANNGAYTDILGWEP